MTGGPPSRPSG